MNLTDLSMKDQSLVLAFVEIAREECIDRCWADIEPVLAKCWSDTHRRTSQLRWADISPFVRTACYENE